jgi:hypothetical protein
MNTKEINPGTKGTLPYYAAFAVPLTLITIWIIIAFQSRCLLVGKPFLVRLGWPYYLIKEWWLAKRKVEGNGVVDCGSTINECLEDIKAKYNDSSV